jgi:hypothetical protein
VTLRLLVNLTFATFLNAELGFLGVLVKTFKQIPFFCEHACNAGVLFKRFFGFLID